jgi:spermidine/putrescine transport system permease protein
MRLFVKKFYLALMLLFLYTPIAVLIVQSFNAGKSRAKWEGFSLRWYAELFHDQAIMRALYVTLSIAVIAAVIATVLGTLAAIGIYAMRKRPQSVMMTLTNLPMTMPDIVTGISLMILFTFSRIERGYVTMLLAHITFNTPYVILSVLPKLRQMNKHTYEAALDLGASPSYALWHVILPKSARGL